MLFKKQTFSLFFKKTFSLLIFIFLIGFPLFVYAQSSNNLLNQINQNSGFSGSTESSDVTNFFERIIPSSTFGGEEGSNNPLNTLLNQIFYIGLAVAVILAIVMIVRGGIQYMTIDAATSKDSGKKMVQAALGGLVLAFAAILILNTINKNITSFTLSFDVLDRAGTLIIERDILNSVSKYVGLTPEQYAEMLATGKIPTDISPTAQKILAEAINTIGFKSSTIPGTDSGNLACAAIVNMIIKNATGQEVGGGFSTEKMGEILASSDRFILVPGGTGASLPGDIIISPTSGKNIGHVGIVQTPGAGVIIQNHSAGNVGTGSGTRWNNFYGGKGLPVLIYRPR